MRHRSSEQVFVWLLSALLLMLTACSSQPAATSSPTSTPIQHVRATPTVRAPLPGSKPEGTLLATYSNHQNKVLDVAWASDNQRLASTDGAVLDIWNAFTGQQLFRYNNTNTTVLNHLTWSPDGRFLAFSDGVNMHIWDTRAKKQTALLASPALWALAWSPDGTYLAMGTSEGSPAVQIWNVATHQTLFSQSEAQEAGASDLAWSPDSQRIAVADRASVQIWDALDGGHPLLYKTNWNLFPTTSWSPDGQQVLLQNGKVVQTINTTTGTLLHTYAGYDLPTIHQALFSPDGTRMLITGGTLRPNVQIRDTQTGNFMYTYLADRNASGNTSGAWSPNSQYVASTQYIVSTGKATIQVWSAAPGGEVLTYDGLASFSGNGDDGVTTVVYSPNGKYLAGAASSTASTGTLLQPINYTQSWSATTGEPVRAYPGKANALAWSPDSKYLASGQAGGIVEVWNALTGQQVQTYHGSQLSMILQVQWSPDGTSLAAADDNDMIWVWDTTTRKLRFSYTTKSVSALPILAWSPNGQYLLTGGVPLLISRAATGKPVFQNTSLPGTVEAATWSPDSKRIASASSDKTVQVWDALTGKNILIYRGHSSAVWLVAWSPDGKHIASVSGSIFQTNVQVWNASSGQNPIVYAGTLSTVNVLSWSPDSQALALGGLDEEDTNLVQVWHLFR